MKTIKPKILKNDDPILICMENDAKHLLNWIEQARRGCNYTTDLIKPIHSSRLDCIKAEAQSILNHVKQCEDEAWMVL